MIRELKDTAKVEAAIVSLFAGTAILMPNESGSDALPAAGSVSAKEPRAETNFTEGDKTWRSDMQTPATPK